MRNRKILLRNNQKFFESMKDHDTEEEIGRYSRKASYPESFLKKEFCKTKSICRSVNSNSYVFRIT